jgi:hypothetical protein
MFGLPFLLLAAFSPECGPCPNCETPSSPTPFAGLLLRRSWPIKFEGQFKYRDERAVNAQGGLDATESRKCLRRKRFRMIVKFGLPCGFASR